MPRPSKGARLYPSKSDGYWYIRDGQKKQSTGCPLSDQEGAERALADYINSKADGPRFGTGDPDKVEILDVLNAYLEGHSLHTKQPRLIIQAIDRLEEF